MNGSLSPGVLRDKLQEWLDQRVEIVLAHLLRGGVLTAAFVVFAGAVMYLGAHARDHADYHTFRAEPEQLRSVHNVIHAALAGQATGILQLGLLLLIATPIARVVFSVFAFALEGDRLYVSFTLLVLSILLYSLFGSFLIA
jgi:uncharacterized membrane protein